MIKSFIQLAPVAKVTHRENDAQIFWGRGGSDITVNMAVISNTSNK